jgi:hypothetical protein
MPAETLFTSQKKNGPGAAAPGPYSLQELATRRRQTIGTP